MSQEFEHKNKLTNHNMRRILKKNPKYRMDYADNNKVEHKEAKIKLVRLSCELCRKFVAEMVGDGWFRENKVKYKRFAKFQVICDNCYQKKLMFKSDKDVIEFKPDNNITLVASRPIKFPEIKTFEILFVNYFDRIRAHELLGLYESNKRAKILDGGWYEIFKVSAEQIEKLKEKGIKFNYLGDYILERQL